MKWKYFLHNPSMDISTFKKIILVSIIKSKMVESTISFEKKCYLERDIWGFTPLPCQTSVEFY